eukprot:12207189-Alexandrium_andersonii.AAC.1
MELEAGHVRAPPVHQALRQPPPTCCRAAPPIGAQLCAAIFCDSGLGVPSTTCWVACPLQSPKPCHKRMNVQTMLFGGLPNV